MQITGSTGCIASGTVNVIINDIPNTPAISALNAVICDNDSLVLQTQTYTGASVQYIWYRGLPPFGVAIDTTSIPVEILNNLPPGTDNYYVLVEVAGCQSNPSQAISTNVIQAPLAATNNDTIRICEGESIVLGTPVIGPGLSYQWFGPNGYSDTLPNPAALLNASLLNTGTYTLIITAGSCPSSPATTEVIVKPNPEQPLIINNGPICIEDTVQLSTNILDAEFYIWRSATFDRDTTTVPTFDVAYFAPGNFSWQVQVIKDGCHSLFSDFTMAIVEAIPIISATNSGPFCPGDPLELFVDEFTDAQYHWAGPGGFTSNQVNPVTAPVMGRYYVTVTTVGGCVGLDSTDVIVKTPPNIDEIDFDTLDCVSGFEDVTLTPSISPMGTYTYFWEGPNYSSTAPSPVLTNVTSMDNGTYTLVVTDIDGCTSAPFSITLDMTDVPVIPELGSVGPLCENDALLLTVTNGSPALMYHWILPVGDTIITSTSALNLPSITVNDAGDYTVVTSLNGCYSQEAVPLMVVVNPIPDTPRIIAPMTICEGEDLQLETDLIANAMYHWTGPNNLDETNASVTIFGVTVLNSGIYSLEIEINGCLSAAQLLDITVKPKPTQPDLRNDGPICEDEALRLFTDFVGADEYIWISPSFKEYTTDQSFIVIDRDSVEAGAWQLIVVVDGCASERSLPSNVIITSKPITPNINPLDRSLCVGEALVVQSTDFSPIQTEYHWLTPNGEIVTPVSELVINQADLGNSGVYALYAIVNGCSSDTSQFVNIQVFELPDTPLASSNGPVCEGDSIRLQASDIPNANYFWLGPVTSTLQNPVIFALPDRGGTYSVFVEVNGCFSDTASVDVAVIDREDTPEGFSNGEVCLDDNDACIELFISSPINGATYTWYDASNDTIVAVSGQTFVQLCDLENYVEGDKQFYVTASIDDCQTLPSLPINVSLHRIPDEPAVAGDSLFLCGLQTTTIAAELTNFPGTWTQVCGPIVDLANPASATTSVGGLEINQSYCFVWTLNYGICGTDSDTLYMFVDDPGEQAFAGDTLEWCNVTSGFLNADPAPNGSMGTWSQPISQESAGVVITDFTDPNTIIEGLMPGNIYIFTWTLGNEGCAPSSDDVIVEVMSIDSTQANCGPDIVACGDGSVELECNQPLIGDGFWTALDPDVNIVSIDEPNTIALGLEEGPNVFIWTLSNNICGIFSLDTLVVNYEFGPLANPDLDSVAFGGSTDIVVVTNDELFQDYTLSVSIDPMHGSVEVLDNETIRYTVNPTFAGEDEFFYELCSVTCPDVCSQAKVSVRVIRVGCTPPSIITPNNDGVNDAFIVPCLETDGFPANRISIFNQWGDEVYGAAPYFNDWKGTYKGKDLPAGTYFYTIDYGGNFPAQSGFLIIKR